MGTYATKICNFCGIKGPANEMCRVNKTYTTKIKNTVTARDVVGAALGSKTSKRSLTKAIFSGGGRKASRTTEVWSCYKCAGRESPAERQARIDEEARKEQEARDKEAAEKISEARKKDRIKKVVDEVISLDSGEFNERIANFRRLVSEDTSLSDRDQKLLLASAERLRTNSDQLFSGIKQTFYEQAAELTESPDILSTLPGALYQNKIDLKDRNALPELKSQREAQGALVSMAVLIALIFVADSVATYAGFAICYFVALAFYFPLMEKKERVSITSAPLLGALANLESDIIQEAVTKVLIAREKYTENQKSFAAKLGSQEERADKAQESIRGLVTQLVEQQNAKLIALYVLAWCIARADGRVSGTELVEVNRQAQLSQAERDLAERLCSHATTKFPRQIIDPLTKYLKLKSGPDEKKAFVQSLISVAILDENLDANENDMIRHIAKGLGVHLASVSRQLNTYQNQFSSRIIEENEALDDEGLVDELFE